MTVTMKEFLTGKGWYLVVDGQSVCALLPSDIQAIVNRWGSPASKQRIANIVDDEYYKRMQEELGTSKK